MAENDWVTLCAQEGCLKVPVGIIRTENAGIINVCGDHLAQFLSPIPHTDDDSIITETCEIVFSGPYESLEGGELRPVEFSGPVVDNDHSILLVDGEPLTREEQEEAFGP